MPTNSPDRVENAAMNEKASTTTPAPAAPERTIDKLHRETGIPMWALEIAFELLEYGMLDEETMAGIKVIPDTARIIAARVRADSEGGGAALETIYKAVEEALNGYRMRHTLEAPDLEHGLSLVDRLSPDEDKDVTRGREELDALIDHVCGSVGDVFRAAVAEPTATMAREEIDSNEQQGEAPEPRNAFGKPLFPESITMVACNQCFDAMLWPLRCGHVHVEIYSREYARSRASVAAPDSEAKAKAIVEEYKQRVIQLPSGDAVPCAKWLEMRLRIAFDLAASSLPASHAVSVVPAVSDDEDLLERVAVKLEFLENASYGELRASVETNREYTPAPDEPCIGQDDPSYKHFKNYATTEEWAVAERVSGWFQSRISEIANITKELRAATTTSPAAQPHYERLLTTEWDATNARRHELASAKAERELSDTEAAEFRELQWLADLKRELLSGPSRAARPEYPVRVGPPPDNFDLGEAMRTIIDGETSEGEQEL